MGHRERCEGRDRAIRKGREAFQAGVPIEANPYKEPRSIAGIFNTRAEGAWSLHPFWRMGWRQALDEWSKTPVDK
jgi:hypothetical protein